jgi:hypothetical protein
LSKNFKLSFAVCNKKSQRSICYYRWPETHTTSLHYVPPASLSRSLLSFCWR